MGGYGSSSGSAGCSIKSRPPARQTSRTACMAVSKRRDPRSRRRRSKAVNDMSLRPQGSRR
eukprot:313982-Pyramimonas_sp.AAC.1